MVIRLLAVGDKMPAWVNAGFQDYAKRLPPHCALELVEIPIAQRTKNTVIAQAVATEGAHLLRFIKPTHHVIALAIQGKAWSTVELSEQLARWQQQGQNIDLIVGGPDGLDPAVLDRAQQRWSLSNLTLPHPLVRILVAEQLYRAHSLLSNHPYHR